MPSQKLSSLQVSSAWKEKAQSGSRVQTESGCVKNCTSDSERFISTRHLFVFRGQLAVRASGWEMQKEQCYGFVFYPASPFPTFFKNLLWSLTYLQNAMWIELTGGSYYHLCWFLDNWVFTLGDKILHLGGLLIWTNKSRFWNFFAPKIKLYWGGGHTEVSRPCTMPLSFPYIQSRRSWKKHVCFIFEMR